MSSTTSSLISFLFCGVLLVLIVGIPGLLLSRLLRPSSRRLPKQARPAQELAASHAPPEWRSASDAKTQLPYARTPHLLTDAERSFYQMLLQATPSSLVVFPQVRLANLVHTTERRPKQRQYDFYRIQAKCVDFVLCDVATTAPRLVVELDDASHQQRHRQERDAFVDAVLATVGIPILHVPWQRAYDPVQLGRQVCEKLGMAGSVATTAPAALPHSPPLPQARPVLATVSTTAQTQASAGIPRQEVRWACGQCHREVTSTAKYCPHCSAILQLS
jgi:hypothetical protein